MNEHSQLFYASQLAEDQCDVINGVVKYRFKYKPFDYSYVVVNCVIDGIKRIINFDRNGEFDSCEPYINFGIAFIDCDVDVLYIESSYDIDNVNVEYEYSLER